MVFLRTRNLEESGLSSAGLRGGMTKVENFRILTEVFTVSHGDRKK